MRVHKFRHTEFILQYLDLKVIFRPGSLSFYCSTVTGERLMCIGLVKINLVTLNALIVRVTTAVHLLLSLRTEGCMHSFLN